jgi:fructose-bisphosphate aldolase class I
VDTEQFEIVRTGRGFFAALDQSGGSTPHALAEYGIERDRYSSANEMFDLVHAMRTRIITNAAFDGSRILAAILFLQTMERRIDGVPTAQYLWSTKHVVPFLKVDLGLAPEQDDVQLMKPIDNLDDQLELANRNKIFGTKMRSVIKDANEVGIAAIVDQQFEYADRIRAAGLVPIIEPEVSIGSPHKAQAESMLRDAIAKHVDALPADARVMIKITIPTQVGLYGELAADPRVLRIVALSGGYSRDEACALLVRDPTLIASFSRGLLEGLTEGQTDAEFGATLEHSVAEIYRASVDKQPSSASLPAGPPPTSGDRRRRRRNTRPFGRLLLDFSRTGACSRAVTSGAACARRRGRSAACSRCHRGCAGRTPGTARAGGQARPDRGTRRVRGQRGR